MNSVKVIGAGLAGCEAALQLASRDIDVELYEMKPEKKTPAHSSDALAELVCSNSLRGSSLETAPGLLKEELRRCGSLIMFAADRHKVPSGGSLSVDREKFSAEITDMIKSNPRITFISKEVTVLPEDGPVIIATGPLTSEALSQDIVRFFGSESPLSFFDAAAPIVEFDSIDMTKAFFASRYGKGSPDYINCPLDEAEYDAFWRELNGAKTAEVHGFENAKVFEGCMPVEVMAARGRDTLRYGPMKPIGITDPVTGRKAYAVLQLRRDNAEGTLYNIVGFQTHLTFGEQKRVFSMIPALRHASFVRYGVMHRNTYINSPKLLTRYYEARKNPDILFAGQMTGVEGYIESTCSGLYAAVNLARRLKAQPRFTLGSDTAIGALSMYISGGASADFQPMNVNFGILTPLAERIKKNEKKLALSTRALAALDEAIAQSGEDFTAALPKKDPHDED